MEYLQTLLDIVFHLDVYLAEIISVYKNWIYLFLFLVVFCETGLIVAAFLPGDALLFVTGTLAALPDNDMNVHLICILFIIAAIVGDTVNYTIGRKFGNHLLQKNNSRIIKPKHLETTHHFFDKYGGKTIIMARFIPFVRTFAPFVAGMGKMHYDRFVSFNVTGALAWVLSLVYAGFFLGNIEFVRNNLSWFILLIIILSNLPALIEFINKRRKYLLSKRKNNPNK